MMMILVSLGAGPCAPLSTRIKGHRRDCLPGVVAPHAPLNMSADTKKPISSQPQVRVQLVPSSTGCLTIFGFTVKS